MSRWLRKPVPHFCERMIGFSVPQDGVVLVITYDEVHLLRLGEDVSVETDDEFAGYDLYDPDTGLATHRGRDYRIIGLHGGSPIHHSPQGETLMLDPVRESLWIERAGQVGFSEQYRNFSGDWVAATFSPDGQFLLLGCPYDDDFLVYQRQVEAGP